VRAEGLEAVSFKKATMESMGRRRVMNKACDDLIAGISSNCSGVTVATEICHVATVAKNSVHSQISLPSVIGAYEAINATLRVYDVVSES